MELHNQAANRTLISRTVLRGGKRLCVLSPDLTEEILDEPTDEPEQGSEGDAGCGNLPSPVGETQ